MPKTIDEAADEVQKESSAISMSVLQLTHAVKAFTREFDRQQKINHQLAERLAVLEQNHLKAEGKKGPIE